MKVVCVCVCGGKGGLASPMAQVKTTRTSLKVRFEIWSDLALACLGRQYTHTHTVNQLCL